MILMLGPRNSTEKRSTRRTWALITMVVLRARTRKNVKYINLFVFINLKRLFIYSLSLNPLTFIPATRASFSTECVCLLHGLRNPVYVIVTFHSVTPTVCLGWALR